MAQAHTWRSARKSLSRQGYSIHRNWRRSIRYASDFQLTLNGNYGSILYCLQETARYWPKIAIFFPNPRLFNAPADGVPLEVGSAGFAQETRTIGYQAAIKVWWLPFRYHARMWQTDGRTDGHQPTARIALTHSVAR